MTRAMPHNVDPHVITAEERRRLLAGERIADVIPPEGRMIDQTVIMKAGESRRRVING